MNIRYYGSLIRSILGIRPIREWRLRAAYAFPAGVLTIVLLFAAFGAPRAIGSMIGLQHDTPTDMLMERATAVMDALEHVDHVVEDEIDPLVRVLRTYRDDEVLARRVATSLVREGRRAGIQPDILLAVLLVENPWINPSARSPVGATGLMQVMPLHEGNWKKCKGGLEEIETNICYGAQIFRSYLKAENGRYEKALLRYNGCVNGTNTPNCKSYPAAVFARAGKARVIARKPVHNHAVAD